MAKNIIVTATETVEQFLARGGEIKKTIPIAKTPKKVKVTVATTPATEAATKELPTPTTFKEAVAQIPMRAGNMPWQVKIYEFRERNTDLLAKAPAQVRGLVETMRCMEAGFTGKELAHMAHDGGMLVTKSDPHVIFAYYRRQLEALGLTPVGFRHVSHSA